MHNLTLKLHLQVNHNDKGGSRRYQVNYDSFYLGPASDGYRLHASGYSGNGSDGLADYHSGSMFSTGDRDQDESDDNCAEKSSAGFWFYKCHRININGVWGDDESWTGMRWGSYKPTFSEMIVGPQANGCWVT